MNRKLLVTVLCGIAAVVLTIVGTIYCVGCHESPRQLLPGRGVITDRHGVVLVSNDTITFPGSSEHWVVRKYPYPIAAQLLGYVREASISDFFYDEECKRGDIVGRTGVEASYDHVLKSRNGKAGKNLTLTIDYELQRLGELLMEGKAGSIVAIEPSTGEVLCMVSTPTYNPQLLSGVEASSHLHDLQKDSLKPLCNRCVKRMYSPGGVFNTAQGLALLSEEVISSQTRNPCERGFQHDSIHIDCHGHPSPLAITDALSTLCHGFFCHGYLDMMDCTKHGSIQKAMEKWRDDMNSLGFGSQLGIDLLHEKRGVVPNADYYDSAYKGRWSGLTTLGNAIGEGEVKVTPLQLANLSATIANRGFYYIPHVVKEIQDSAIDRKFTQTQATKIRRDAYDTVIRGMRQSVLSGACRVLSKLPVESCGVTTMASPNKECHSVFIGFAPVEHPRIAVAVYVEHGGWGAKYAAPIGGFVMEYFVNGVLSEDSKEKAEQMRLQHISNE